MTGRCDMRGCERPTCIIQRDDLGQVCDELCVHHGRAIVDGKIAALRRFVRVDTGASVVGVVQVSM